MKINYIGLVFLKKLETAIQNDDITDDVIDITFKLKQPVTKEDIIKFSNFIDTPLQIHQQNDAAIIIIPEKDGIQIYHDDIHNQCLLQLLNNKVLANNLDSIYDIQKFLPLKTKN